MLEACPSMCMMDLDYLLCVCQCSPSASVLVSCGMILVNVVTLVCTRNSLRMVMCDNRNM